MDSFSGIIYNLGDFALSFVSKRLASLIIKRIAEVNWTKFYAALEDNIFLDCAEKYKCIAVAPYQRDATILTVFTGNKKLNKP